MADFKNRVTRCGSLLFSEKNLIIHNTFLNLSGSKTKENPLNLLCMIYLEKKVNWRFTHERKERENQKSMAGWVENRERERLSEWMNEYFFRLLAFNVTSVCICASPVLVCSLTLWQAKNTISVEFILLIRDKISQNKYGEWKR